MSEQFLTQAEKLKLEEISHGDSPESGLAQALLALNEGSSYGAAGKPAGLTSRQTRYRRDKFLKLRMGMFSQDITVENIPEAAAPETTEVEQEQSPIEEVEAASEVLSPPEKLEQPQVEEEEVASAEETLTVEEKSIEAEVESQKKSKGSKKRKKKKKKGKSKKKGKKGKKKSG